MQIKKRPRYTIDTKLEDKVDEMYREVVRPRLGLLDNERAAMEQLRTMAQVARSPLAQLPMQDKQASLAFKMMDAH
jgi:hypothetical protein